MRLSITVTAARIRFATGRADGRAKAANELAKAIAEARTLYYFGVKLGGKVAIQLGSLKGGRARLRAVEKDAPGRGLRIGHTKSKGSNLSLPMSRQRN
jgi:hypothetical protein